AGRLGEYHAQKGGPASATLPRPGISTARSPSQVEVLGPVLRKVAVPSNGAGGSTSATLGAAGSGGGEVAGAANGAGGSTSATLGASGSGAVKSPRSPSASTLVRTSIASRKRVTL